VELTPEQLQDKFNEFYEDEQAFFEWINETMVFDVMMEDAELKASVLKAIKSHPVWSKVWMSYCSELAEGERQDPGE